jgi:diguanylate cyclase (GGDEF)-like protein
MNREVDRLVGALDATAAHDPLTGVLNRRGLEERLGIELTRARRTSEPLTVVACDLDNLKLVNDRHGHAAGDEALALVADVIASALRDVDVLARTGGDEFLVLLPNCDIEAGVRIAEDLREQVSAAAQAESWPATVSMGVACAPPQPLDPDALTVAADGALYRAKSLGRDRVSRAGRNELRKAFPAP